MITISPYIEGEALKNIVTGVVADESVNVLLFKSNGEDLLKKMEGKEIFNYTFRRSEKCKTMGTKSAVKVGDNSDISIDSALLFQRLLVLANSSKLTLSDCIKYELCSYPPALFESPSMLCKANKPELKKAIQEYITPELLEPSLAAEHLEETEKYILDGGSLLHKIAWVNNTQYIDIAKQYTSYVICNYDNASVIFDGYPDKPTSKDMTHSRRKTVTSPTIDFHDDMILMVRKLPFSQILAIKEG